MSDQEDKKEAYWLIIFTILPVIILSGLAPELDWGMHQTIVAGILGGIGGGLGTGLYYLSKNRSLKMRSIILGLFTLALILTFVLVNNVGLMTCKVCGYQAVEEKGGDCNVCYAAINKEEMELYENSSFQELILEEQLFFFSTDKKVTSFQEPAVYVDDFFEEEYKKAKNWKPTISWKEVEAEKALEE